MKKILAILALSASGAAFAGSATIEYQNLNGVNGSTDQRNVNLTVRDNITKNLVGDVQLNNTWSEATGAATTFRVESGLTGLAPLGEKSPLSLYSRVALGQRFTTTKDFTYYSVEPGIRADLGSGFVARVGYRFREAFDSVNNDTTRTARANLSYALTKTDAIGVGYNRVRGDTNQNIWAVNYTRGF